MTRYGTDARYAHGKLLTTRPVVHALQNWVKSPTDLRYVSLLSSRLSLSLSLSLALPETETTAAETELQSKPCAKDPLKADKP